MPANIKEVFDKFPKKNKQYTNEIKVINYEDIKKTNSDWSAYDESSQHPEQTQVYAEYQPKKVSINPKPKVTRYVPKKEDSELDNYYYDDLYPYISKESIKKIETITCNEVDRHIADCKECQKKLTKEKIVYIKSNKEETSQEIMELVTFLATGVFIILVLDKVA